MPPMQFDARSVSEVKAGVMPRNNAVYPEYVTDPQIYICPSDANPDPDAMKDSAGNYAFAGDIWDDRIWGCMDDVNVSYAYFGWLLDRMCDDPTQNAQAPADLAGALFALFGASLPPGASGLNIPAQFLGLALAIASGPNVAAFFADPTGYAPQAADKDYTMPDQDPYRTEGNGGGNTVYRLREGVERFVITDINNPAASAKAQSEIFVMLDQFSAAAELFNHIPGGCNVLFMDGHVVFARYPTCNPPVNAGIALIVGAFGS
jgi:prepilin-type processing-associated H-X9-DG protein